MSNKPNRIIFHHTGDLTKTAQAEKVNAYHKSKEFPISLLGYFGGYHYFIERDGAIKQFRLDEEIGAHDGEENINSIGVALAGNFDLEQPTGEQERAVAALLDQLLTRWKIPLARIEPHRWGDQTNCPGKLLNDYWPRVAYLKHKANWITKFLSWNGLN